MCFVLKLRVLTATLLVYPTTPYFDAAYAGAYGIGVKPKKKNCTRSSANLKQCPEKVLSYANNVSLLNI